MRVVFLYFILLLMVNQVHAQYAIGNRKFILKDPARNNRSVLTYVYYPAVSAGTGTPVANDAARFPVVSFGHGFVMSALAYQWLAEALVPSGYIVAFPATEEGVPPIHSEFGKDEVFVARSVRDWGTNDTSFLLGKTNGYTAVGGHSMGGGASFLGMQGVSDVTTFFNFAAAETFLTESAIQKAGSCTQPALIFAGGKDCVAPPAANSLRMYQNTAAEYKCFANIKEGSHCQFADANKTVCELGETLACLGRTYMPRNEQQAVVQALLKPWLDFWTKRDCAAITTYYTNIAARLGSLDTLQSRQITCSALDINTSIASAVNTIPATVFPNPGAGLLQLQIGVPYTSARVELFDLTGKSVDARLLSGQRWVELDYTRFPAGVYLLQLTSEQGNFNQQVVLQ